jgi:hypothetical protein
MMRRLRRWAVVGCAGCTLAATLAAVFSYGPLLSRTVKADTTPKDEALERTRDQVKMLDGLYKNAVVAITKTYDGPPAIKVAKQVFTAMEKDGWHSAKLVDATGNPQSDSNLPSTAFEKKAVDVIRAGKPYYEEVQGEGSKRRLLAATVVPAVMKKCAVCHGVKEGELLGFIRYDVPVK